ncbi:RNA polymerase sigma-70 factor [Salmonirosea aquatica]
MPVPLPAESSHERHAMEQPRPPLKAVSVEPEENKDATHDSELFIRKAFEINPRQGCELLFRRYHQVLCSYAVRFVYSREIAEDLVSDVFCRLWKTKAYESIKSSYRFYLFRCVRNQAYNYLRLEFRKTEGMEAAAHQESSRSHRPDHITQFEEVFARVEVLIESMPPQCRKVFLMNRFEGKKYQEIADETGTSIKTIEVHIGKALAILRKGLKDYWVWSLVSLFVF